MTIEEVIQAIVKALELDLEEGQLDADLTLQQFHPFHPREVAHGEDVIVWSVALNDETTDVRYVMLDGGSGYIGEVVPRVKLVTEYVQV